MFVTVIAVMCHLLAAGPGECREEIVTDTSLDSTVTFQSCMIGGQAALAKWKGEHPIYRAEAWRIERYKCAAGHYKAKVGA